MILETTRSAHPDHPAQHFQYQHTPVEKRPLKISVTTKRLQSRKTCNGLPSNDPIKLGKVIYPKKMIVGNSFRDRLLK
jgi:hypothetical protein